MGKLELKGMEFYAFHGCFEEERVIGNRFIVDFECTTDMERAILSDDINDAVNYQSIYNVIKEEMMIPSNLLEHVAGRILSKICSEFPMITSAVVSVSKLNPPLGGEVGASRVELRVDN